MAGVVEFVLKARDEATKEIQKVSGSLGGLSKVSSSLFSGMGAATAAVTGITAVAAGVLTLSKSIGDSAETLDRQSKSAGTSAANMQAIKLAFENAGLAGDEASTTLGFLNKQIALGNPLLGQMGIRTHDAYQAFLQLSDIFASSTDASKKSYIASTLLGKQMRDSSGVIGELGKATREATGSLAEMHATMTDAAMKSGLALDQQMDALNTRLGAAKQTLSIGITPALIDMITATNDLIAALSKVPAALQWVNTLGGALPKLSASLKARFGDPGADTWDADHVLGHGGGASWGPTGSSGGVDSLKKISAKGQVIIGYDENGDPIMGRPGAKRKGPSAIASMRGIASFDPLMDATKSLRGKTPAAKAIDDMLASLKEVPVPALKITDAFTIAAARMDAGGNLIRGMQQTVSSNISTAVDNVIGGTQSIADAFTSMTESILADIAAQAAKYGIGMFLSTFGGPVGAIGVGLMGGSSSTFSPAGGASPAGNTYYISSIDTKSIQQSLTSPTGAMRRANDRMRDVRMAR